MAIDRAMHTRTPASPKSRPRHSSECPGQLQILPFPLFHYYLITRRTKAFLENRLYFATKRIERSYLFYELADAYLGQHQQVVCLSYAKKAIDEAKLCNSKIWQFLATMLQAKSHAILCKFERQAEVLNEAYALARSLKSPRLCTFIELCRMLNRDYISLRKMTHLMSTKRMRYKMSTRSSTNQHTSDSEMDT